MPRKDSEMTKVLVVSTLEEVDCDYMGLCFCSGSGCKKSAMKACPIAVEVNEWAAKKECKAVGGSRCEIPQYHMLVAKKKIPCGCKDRCYLAQILQGLIPPQDFASAGKIPESYKRPRAPREKLVEVLRANGM